MISIGVDAHKGAHVATALDAAGRAMGQWAGPNSAEGWAEIAAWARSLGDERRWGIEGAWNYGRGLAQHLVAAGEAVHEVNTRWTARATSSAQRWQDGCARRAGHRAAHLARGGDAAARGGRRRDGRARGADDAARGRGG